MPYKLKKEMEEYLKHPITFTVDVDIANAAAGLEELECRAKKIDSILNEAVQKSEKLSSTFGEEIPEPIAKEEILEDFSTEELVRELEKRGAANIYRTDDRNLFVFTGNFCTG